MNPQEKIYRTMSNTGAAGIAVGIVTAVIGLAAGIVMIVTGARLLMRRRDIMI